jgi:hypothetical protein
MEQGILMKKCLFVVSVVLIALLAGWPETGMAGQEKPTFAFYYETLKERFSFDLRILTYGIIQEPANSNQNSENNLLQIPHYLADLEIRPDLRLNLDFLDLSAKPRMRLEYCIWREGNLEGQSEWNDDRYVNEWLARLKARENLFLSYGRENLQWGPSFLFSPSNPYFQDNGRRNPYLEVPGMDFGRLIWIPGSSWTISFIANIDEGQNKIIGPILFEKTYSLKVDYTGRENYGSIILSHREGSENLLGFYGGWTISDAILLYGEGVITQGSEALYPKKDSSPFGASMIKLHEDDSTIKPVFLAGGSYTFRTSGTLTMEYAYYGPGYSDAQADIYYRLKRNAAGEISSGGLVSALGQMTLGQTAVTGLRFLRKNYALLQYTQNNIKNNVDLFLRWAQNLDDGSGQFTTVVTYSLGKHLELFSVGTVTAGDNDTEFGSILDYQWMIGLKYTF